MATKSEFDIGTLIGHLQKAQRGFGMLHFGTLLCRRERLSMDAQTCIRTKRDSREYKSQPVSDEVLQQILQAGRMAGSSKNTQPWHFVVLRDDARKAELAACGDFAKHVPAAPLVIAVVLSPGGGAFDAGRAAQNMMIVAWDEGLASCPLRIHRADCGREVLGLPEGWRIAIVVALGHPQPGTSMSQDRARKPFEEYVSWERFGQSSP